MRMDFRILGPVEVLVDGRAVPLGGSKPLIVLAGLLLRANHLVTVDQLAEWLWADQQPRNARAAIQNYVARVRRAVGSADVLRTESGGYRAVVDAERLDVARFDAGVVAGRRALDAGQPIAVEYVADALAEWRGTPLSNVDSDVLARDELPALLEKWLPAKQLWADAMLLAGRHTEAIGELSTLVTEHPLAERLHEQLMLALYRDGRKADALDVYRRLSGALADELGLDPDPALRRLHQRILTADPALDTPDLTSKLAMSDPKPPDAKPVATQAIPPPASTTPAERQVPRQLPSNIGAFTGRAAELDQLRALANQTTGRSVIIAAIEGTAGAGKTALAVHFGHEIADRFTDGQLYLDLRGYGPGDPLSPASALETLLQSVGVTGDHVPADLDARAAMWRTHTTDRALLVILDNARDTEQVRPLLPGVGLVLVTSRAQLRGLAARERATRVLVGEFAEADALTLLTETLGAQRIQANPAATRRFLDRCARLPLAIRILAERASLQPDVPLAEFLDDLDSETGLDAFDLEDDESTNLGAVFTYSYRALDDESARLFRLLGLHPGPDMSVAVTAALAGLPVGKTRRLLDRLARANLIQHLRPGRVQLHDLLREFAADRVRHDEPRQSRAEATDRMLDFYLHATIRAATTMDPARSYELVEPDGLALPTFDDYREAIDWFDAERGNVMAAIEFAKAAENHEYVCWISWPFSLYFNVVFLQDVETETTKTALTSAQMIGDKRFEARFLSALGIVHCRYDSIDSGIDYFQRCLDLIKETDDVVGVCGTLNNLSEACRITGRYDDSVDYARQARELAVGINSPTQILRAVCNLTQSLVAADEFSAADEYADEGLRVLAGREEELPDYLVLVLRGKANALAGTKRLDAAVEHLHRARELSKRIGHREYQADMAADLAGVYAALEDFSSAINYQREAVELLSTGGSRVIAQAHAKLAELEILATKH